MNTQFTSAELSSISALVVEARLMHERDKAMFKENGIANAGITKTLEDKEKYISIVEGLVDRHQHQAAQMGAIAFDQFVESDIADLRLSIGIIASLKAHGFTKVGQLAQATKVDLLKIPNIGLGKFESIKAALEDYRAGFKS